MPLREQKIHSRASSSSNICCPTKTGDKKHASHQASHFLENASLQIHAPFFVLKLWQSLLVIAYLHIILESMQVDELDDVLDIFETETRLSGMSSISLEQLGKIKFDAAAADGDTNSTCAICLQVSHYQVRYISFLPNMLLHVLRVCLCFLIGNLGLAYLCQIITTESHRLLNS